MLSRYNSVASALQDRSDNSSASQFLVPFTCVARFHRGLETRVSVHRAKVCENSSTQRWQLGQAQGRRATYLQGQGERQSLTVQGSVFGACSIALSICKLFLEVSLEGGYARWRGFGRACSQSVHGGAGSLPRWILPNSCKCQIHLRRGQGSS
jgi:hypothetical protein